ncbi:MAG TPA: ArsA family ATPase, partial [Mycobacterium sp.]|nr:ArsA family ATPase [Mycobacterium sp.]
TFESGPDATDATGANVLTKAILQIHADRASTSKREIRLLSRFTGANPHVAIVGVPSLPFDVSDLEALRAIADQMTAAS